MSVNDMLRSPIAKVRFCSHADRTPPTAVSGGGWSLPAEGGPLRPSSVIRHEKRKTPAHTHSQKKPSASKTKLADGKVDIYIGSNPAPLPTVTVPITNTNMNARTVDHRSAVEHRAHDHRSGDQISRRQHSPNRRDPPPHHHPGIGVGICDQRKTSNQNNHQQHALNHDSFSSKTDCSPPAASGADELNWTRFVPRWQ